MGTTAQKGAYLNTTKSELKQAINNLGGTIDDNTTFRQYANQLQGVYDNYPKTSYGEGTSVTLENCNKGKLDFEDGKVGFGQSSQKNTQGYQLLPINDIPKTTRNGITYSVSNGILEIDGTATGGFEIWLYGTSTQGLFSLESGEYTFAGQVISGSRVSGVCGKYVRNASGSNNIIDGNQIEALVNKTLDTNYSNLSCYLYISNGTVLDKLKVGLSLYKGSYTSQTLPVWEQYSGGYASPSPNWKQEVKCVRGKNLIGLGTQLNGYRRQDNGKFNGDDTCIGYYFKTSDLPRVITISCVNGNRANVSYYNTIPQTGTDSVAYDNSTTLPRTININMSYKYVHIQFSYNETNVTNIQLEERNTSYSISTI